MKKLTHEEKKALAKECYLKIVNFAGELESYMDADIRIYGITRICVEIDDECFLKENLFDNYSRFATDKAAEALIKNHLPNPK